MLPWFIPGREALNTEMDRIYDVAVIGAGPGGGRAAMGCADKGLSTVILEKKSVVGIPVHCGECLSSFAAENTGLKIPDHVISMRVKGVKIIFPNNSAKKLYEPGYVLFKDRFEQWLVETACNAGAQLCLHFNVKGIKRTEDIWSIRSSSGETVKARLVIDASGVASICSNLLKINRKFITITGIQHEIEGVSTDGFIEFYLWPGLAPEGYLWVIPKSGNSSNVGLISTKTGNLKKNLDDFINRKNFNIINIRKTFGGRIPSSGPLPVTFSTGLIIIGDAAGFTSPLFEGGTHFALKSGWIASEIAGNAVKSNDLSKQRLSEYQKFWEKEFPDYRRIIKGRSALYNFSEQELNLFTKYIPDKIDGFSLNQKIGAGLCILCSRPGLIGRGGISMLKAFELSRAIHYGW